MFVSHINAIDNIVYLNHSIVNKKKVIKKAWQLAILAGLDQLLSPPLSLTSVFGMGTGVSSATSSPDLFKDQTIFEN